MSQTPELMQLARDKKARFFLQFGGTGTPWYKELRVLFGEPSMKDFFDLALAAIEAEVTTVGETVGLPHGLDVRAWLQDESKIPSEDYLGCAGVSIPMIQLTQLANVELLAQRGFPTAELLEYTEGGAGHSQGIMPIALVAMGLAGDEYLRALEKFLKYMLTLALRAQEVHPYMDATAAEIEQSRALGGKTPTPMAALLGCDDDTAQRLVAEVNADLAENEKVHISLYNSPTNRILSSHRSSLVAFFKRHKDFIAENKFKFVYLRTTCPFHSALMEGMGARFEPDIARLEFNFSGKSLKFPIHSYADGRNIQDDADLGLSFYKDIILHALIWEKSIQPAAKNDKITHVIDFGLSKASQRLTADTFADWKCDKIVASVSNAKDLKTIFT